MTIEDLQIWKNRKIITYWIPTKGQGRHTLSVTARGRRDHFRVTGYCVLLMSLRVVSAFAGRLGESVDGL